MLHYTLRPLLGWRAPVDFLVIALLLAAVRVRPGAAAVIGFCSGSSPTRSTPSAFGAGALAMTAVGFGASWLKAVFFADNVVAQRVLLLSSGSGRSTSSTSSLSGGCTASSSCTQLLLWSPLSAAVTAVAGRHAAVHACGQCWSRTAA